MLHFDTSRAEGVSNGFSLLRARRGKCPPSLSAPFPNRRGQESRAKGRHPQTGRANADTSKEEGSFSLKHPQRRVGGSVRAVKWLIESLMKWLPLGLITFIRIKSYLRLSFFFYHVVLIYLFVWCFKACTISFLLLLYYFIFLIYQ